MQLICFGVITDHYDAFTFITVCYLFFEFQLCVSFQRGRNVSASRIAKRAALPFHVIYILFSHCFGFCNCCKVALANHLFC